MLQPGPRTFECLALLLDCPADELAAAWEPLAAGRGYRSFTLTRGQKSRLVHVPDPPLGAVQTRILGRILKGGTVSPAAYAGVPGRSFLDAARLHLPRAHQVLLMDLRDAFGSAKYRFVRQALRERLRLELRAFPAPLRSDLVDVVAHLVTVPCGHGTRCLPLGAPTSVAAFNVVLVRFDREVRVLLHRLASPQVVYTRYVDDLVFSSSGPLPADLEHEVEVLARKHGFEIAPEKTRRAEGSAVAVHGLAWSWDGLILSEALAARCRERIAAHAAGLASPGAGRSEAAARAAAALRALDVFLKQVFVPPRQRPAELRFDLPAPAAPAPVEEVADLWR